MVKFYPFKVMLLAITLITQYSFSQLAQNAPNEEKQTVSKEQQKQLLQNNQSQIGFEENKGQVSDFNGAPVDEVLFRASMPDYTIFFTEEGISYVMYSYKQSELHSKDEDHLSNDSVSFARVDLTLIGANIQKENMVMEDKLPGFSSYYLAHCAEGVKTHKYRKIRIKNIYPGIDWVFRYDGEQMHHEFEIEPTADAGLIKMQVDWADVKLQDDGKKMLLETPLGTIEDGDIFAFEEKSKKEVEVNYHKNEKNIVSYNVKGSRNDEKLIIDPPLSLLWGTYFGGSDADEFTNVKTDASGNVFVTGVIRSTDFPTLNPGGGAYFQGVNGGGTNDLTIVKFDNTGVLLWSTYYGGSGIDNGLSLTIDNLGNVYVVGNTTSTNLPTLNPGGGAYYQASNAGGGDGYILKFNNTGERLWATYFGGNSTEWLISIETDSFDNIYVVGRSSSATIPTLDMGGGAYYQGTNAGSSGSRDGIMLKFSNAGVLLWSTFYGGSANDQFNSIALDASGNIFIGAQVYSTDFPTFDPGAGAYFQGTHGGGTDDLGILKFSPSGQVLWSTYYGGSDRESSNFSITTDNNGNLFVTGEVNSIDFPTFDPGGTAYFQNSLLGNWDLYLLKFNNTGERLWATYYGGNDSEFTGNYSAISTDGSNNIFITGRTRSIDFPTQDPGGGAYYLGTKASSLGYDIVILQFNNNGESLWSTFGSASHRSRSITNDLNGNAFVVGFTLASSGTIIYDPGGGAYFQGTNNGSNGGLISKFESNTGCTSPTQPVAISGSTVLCENATETYSVTNDPNATSYTWTLPSGWSGTSTTNSITVTAGASGGTIEVTANNACGSSTSQTLSVTANASPSVIASGTASICDGESTTITASGATNYSWDNGAGTGSSVSVAPTTNTTYTVTGTDGNGCENTDDVTITVNLLPTVTASADEAICEGESTSISASGANNYSWSNGAGTGSSVSVAPTTNTTYTVTGTDGNGCENTDDVTITVNPLPTVTASADEAICEGESTTISASGAIAFTWDNGLGSGSTQTVSPTSNTTYTVTGTDANGCENTDDVTISTQIVPDNGVTLESDQVTITANSTGIDYMWVDCENNFQAIPGETNQSFTADSNGSYAVIVSNQGCADTSDCVVIDRVSLASNKFNMNISLVPNPTKSITKIVTDVQISNVQVVDFSGKIIEVPQNKSENELNFSNLPVGTYFIQIQTLNGNYVERVVVI
ncbi:MAG: SBBP repeat-containing protein [Bacteroidota bacterium]